MKMIYSETQNQILTLIYMWEAFFHSPCFTPDYFWNVSFCSDTVFKLFLPAVFNFERRFHLLLILFWDVLWMDH